MRPLSVIALASAPASSRNPTLRGLSLSNAAMCRAVRPLPSRASRSAPAWSRNSTASRPPALNCCRGRVQSRPPVSVPRFKVGSSLEQNLHNGRTRVAARSRVQWRPARRIARHDIGTGLEQQRDDSWTRMRTGRQMQRCLTPVLARGRVRARSQKCLDYRGVPVELRRPMQGREPAVTPRFDFSPCVQQQFDYDRLRMVAGGPVQRRFIVVNIPRHHIRPGFNASAHFPDARRLEELHAPRIAAHRRAHQQVRSNS